MEKERKRREGIKNKEKGSGTQKSCKIAVVAVVVRSAVDGRRSAIGHCHPHAVAVLTACTVCRPLP